MTAAGDLPNWCLTVCITGRYNVPSVVQNKGIGRLPMAVVTIDSNQARYNWRTVLDAAEKGDAVITRYGKPIAAVIDHDTWLAVHKYIEAYRRARIQRAIDEWNQDPSTARPWSEIQQEMIAEGLLDAPPT